MTPNQNRNYSFTFLLLFAFGTLLFTSCEKDTPIYPDQETNTETIEDRLPLDFAVDPIDNPIERPATNSTVNVPPPRFLGNISDYTTAIEGYTNEQNPKYDLDEENDHGLQEME